mmetsp:Transcript_22076/g.28565  ORF Transcript_22076/g.28565 Transcript_22076/m.28565 type:complete len:288 (+) Transcript_22076:79-942(+)
MATKFPDLTRRAATRLAPTLSFLPGTIRQVSSTSACNYRLGSTIESLRPRTGNQAPLSSLRNNRLRATSSTFCQQDAASSLSRQKRSFARPARPAARPNQPLSNEPLIVEIMKQSKKSSPDSVLVRLVVEEKFTEGGGERKSTVEVVPLSSAIQTAVELDLDLIAIALNQDVPVIKAADISAVVYRSKKKHQENKSSKLSEKEFQFKVSIAENDMIRKVEQMVGFLQKGHTCTVRVRCPGWMARQDGSRVETFLKKITKLVEEDAKPTGSPSVNEGKTVGILKFVKN